MMAGFTGRGPLRR